MIVLQQLKLSIEESHNANDGNAQSGGEEHFVEHLFLLVSDPGLGHLARICSPCYRLDWSENWPAKLVPACYGPLSVSMASERLAIRPRQLKTSKCRITALRVLDPV